MGGSKAAPPKRASPLMQQAAPLSSKQRDQLAQAEAAAAQQAGSLAERRKVQMAAHKASQKGEEMDPWAELTMMRDLTVSGEGAPRAKSLGCRGPWGRAQVAGPMAGAVRPCCAAVQASGGGVLPAAL